MNFEKSRFSLNTKESVKSNYPIAGTDSRGTAYTVTNIVSSWNVSLRSLMRNTFDKYTRVFLEVQMITTSIGNGSLGAAQTYDNQHVLRLSGLNFINSSTNYSNITSFLTTRSAGGITNCIDDNGEVVSLDTDNVTIVATMLGMELLPNNSGGVAWPDYVIFFNCYGIPGYERFQLSDNNNKNNY